MSPSVIWAHPGFPNCACSLGCRSGALRVGGQSQQSIVVAGLCLAPGPPADPRLLPWRRADVESVIPRPAQQLIKERCPLQMHDFSNLLEKSHRLTPSPRRDRRPPTGRSAGGGLCPAGQVREGGRCSGGTRSSPGDIRMKQPSHETRNRDGTSGVAGHWSVRPRL